MKQLVLLCSFLLTVTVSDGQSNLAQTKRALLIALQQYDLNEWTPIHSANDTLLLKPVLLAQGFQPTSITVLNDKQGKYKSLLAAIDAFIKTCDSNDIVYFHFSGHGQSVADRSGDEADGYDEAIVPIDAPATFAENGYRGERHIIDDKLDSVFNQIRQRIGMGGDLFISIDACYSGTATRKLSFTRGKAVPLASEQHLKRFPLQNVMTEKSISLARKDNRAVAFSACSAYEEDVEYTSNGKTYGPLSYAMADCLMKMEGGTTYASLFEQVKVKMSAMGLKQTPLIEGIDNKLVLNGAFVPFVKSFLPNPSSYHPPTRTYKLSYGQLQGFFPKTTVAIHELTTQNPTSVSPVAMGEVISSDAVSCVIKVNKNMLPLDPNRKKVFIAQPSFGDLAIRVKLDISGAEPIENALRQKLQSYPAVHIVQDETANLNVECNNIFLKGLAKPSNYLQISDKSGLVIDSFTIDLTNVTSQVESVEKRILNYMFGGYLKQLEATSTRYKGEIGFILGEPCREEPDGTVLFRPRPKESYTQSSNYYRAPDGSCFRLEIKNNGDQRFYYSVLLINPKNEIEFLLPGDGESAASKALTREKRMELEPSPSAFQVQPPYGKDVYKLIVTSSPLDLRLIMTSGTKNIPAGNSGGNNLYDVLRTAGMGLKTPPPAKTDINIKTFVVDVVEE